MAIAPSLLLHSCCGPCSTAVIERLMEEYAMTIFFYNPNVTDEEEYLKRKAAQKLFLEKYAPKSPIGFLEGSYEPEIFLNICEGLENEAEGGARCSLCFKLRLEKTAAFAKEKGFAFFGTTLSVSPHKNADLINSIGLDLSAQYGIQYLISDFKKKDGYVRSIQMAKEYDLYRQHYCGCIYSIPK